MVYKKCRVRQAFVLHCSEAFLNPPKSAVVLNFGQFPLTAIASRLSLANLLPEILFVQESKSLSVVIRARNSAAGVTLCAVEFTDHVLLLAVLVLAPLHRSMPG